MANTHRNHALGLLEHYFGIAGVAVTASVREGLAECVDAIIAASGSEAAAAIEERFAAAAAEPSRRVVQIAAVPETTEGFEALYALAADGSVWIMERPQRLLPDSTHWKQLPPLPGVWQTLPTGGI